MSRHGWVCGACFEQALRDVRNPYPERARYGLAWAYFIQEEFDRALESMKEVVVSPQGGTDPLLGSPSRSSGVGTSYLEAT